ncbi:MAG: tetratricopeptide repeat protein [Candidatus Hodarchaeota archaeon]
MSSEALIATIDEWIDKEAFDKVLRKIDENLIAEDYSNLLKPGETSSEVISQLYRQWELLLHKSKVFKIVGTFPQALALAERVVAENKIVGEATKLMQFRAEVKKADCLAWQGNLNEAFEASFELLEQLERLPESQKKSLEYERASLLITTGVFYAFVSKFDLAHKHHEEAIRILTKYDDHLLSEALGFNGFPYLHKGDYNKAYNELGKCEDHCKKKGHIGYLIHSIGIRCFGPFWEGKLDLAENIAQEGVRIAKEYNNPFWLGYIQTRLGAIYAAKGEFLKAEDTHQEAARLVKAAGQKFMLAENVHRLGNLSRIKGDYDQAIDYFTQSLQYYEEVQFALSNAMIYDGLGEVYREKGEFQLAADSYQESLEIHKKAGNQPLTAKSLFNLFLTHMDQHKLEEANSYLDRLNHLTSLEDAESIMHRAQLAKALMLNESDRVLQKAQAQQIFEKLANEENIEHDIQTYAAFSLCTLYLYEMRASGNEAIFTDLYSILDKLDGVATEQNILALNVKTLMLRAQITLIEGNIEAAAEFLDQAREIAASHYLGYLINRIEQDQDALNQQIEQWQELIARNASIQERLEQAQLEKYIDEAQKLVSSLSQP